MKILQAAEVKLGSMCLTLGLALTMPFSVQFSASAADVQTLLKVKGGWQVQFDSSTSTLECLHPASGTRLSGNITFAVVRNGKTVSWQVQRSRDFVPERLALLDEHQDAQGYVTVSGDANRLEFKVLPRPPQLFGGELVFSPDIRFGAGAFACRTEMSAGTRVVQMASGAADSLLNDSVFDIERDVVLRFRGKTVAISTVSSPSNATSFLARLTADIENPERSSISVGILPDYYRSQYVPNYRPIDRKRCPSAPTGWMSWNVYFDTAGERENLDEARTGARFLKPYGLEIWSIESWQDNSPRLPVSDFYNLTLKADPVKFPHGMKWLAGEIRALGFRPGIWTVPWGTGDESFYREHRDWFLHDGHGKPMRNWSGRYVLDPSQQQVRRHMEETHRVMSKDWGYEFFKIDGMSGRGPGYSAHFFERPEVRAAFRGSVRDAYSSCVKSLRRGIGEDRILLACQGHYTGPEVGWADAARLGADIVHPNQPPHWENYLNQAKLTQAQLFTHNIVWYSDPDTLLVGEPASLDMVRLATTVVALPGQLTFFGDKLGQLPPSRMRLLQQALPACNVRALDLLPLPDLKPIWDLKIRRPFAAWDVMSMFNWGDEARDFRFQFAELGLDPNKEYLVYDFWNGALIGTRREHVECRVNARANVLLAIHEKLDRPQVLSTDRHIAQGGVEWVASSWNENRSELACSFNLVENDPLTVAIHADAPYRFTGAKSDAAEVQTRTSDPILYVTLRRPTSGEAKLTASFGLRR